MSKLFFKLLYMISIISIINTEYCPKHLQSTSNSLRSSIDNHPTLSSTLMKSTEQINQLGNSYSLDDIDQCYDGTYGDQKIDLFNMSINEIVHDYFVSFFSTTKQTKNKQNPSIFPKKIIIIIFIFLTTDVSTNITWNNE